MKQCGDPVCHLLLADDTKQDFQNLDNPNKADFVIVGDIGDAWSYELLNTVFNQMIKGARLIVIDKNRFWQS